MISSLNSPAITELSVESAPLNLINEWLRAWFNGTSQTIGNNPPNMFPKVNVAFNQSPPTQPLYEFAQGIDTEIRIVMVPRRTEEMSCDTKLYSGLLVTSHVSIQFIISAKHPGPGMSQQSAQSVAELLHGILGNPASRSLLAFKGITTARPGEILPVPSADYAKRLLVCGAQLQWPVQFTPAE